mmetsp:Transcript_65463/g.184340  ORF Transcript_65463/g.184340 Transcript_65463/m.184340 type:complete len:210 (+) Transcript_65463:334-963(+)
MAWADATASSGVFVKVSNVSSTSMPWYLNSAIASSLWTFGSYTCTWAPSCISMSHTVSAGVSRTSPVSFLNAKPRTAIFFLVTVLNSAWMMRMVKVFFWYSFMFTTCCQYEATSSRPNCSQMYTRFRMSFWKQDPPKPMDAFKNFGPMRESVPIARDTSPISAPVRSQSLEMELMLLTRCASIALATSLESSELQRLVVRILSRGTQCA